jgi:hypothetical protein
MVVMNSFIWTNFQLFKPFVAIVLSKQSYQCVLQNVRKMYHQQPKQNLEAAKYTTVITVIWCSQPGSS